SPGPENKAVHDDSASKANLGFIHAFVASISVIIVSELGDKTFFIAAIMAMRYNRLTVLAGAMLALGLMTCLSVLFGYATTIIPRIYTYYVSTALFAIFGVRMLREGLKMSPDEGQEELEEVQAEIKKKDEEHILPHPPWGKNPSVSEISLVYTGMVCNIADITRCGGTLCVCVQFHSGGSPKSMEPEILNNSQLESCWCCSSKVLNKVKAGIKDFNTSLQLAKGGKWWEKQKRSWLCFSGTVRNNVCLAGVFEDIYCELKIKTWDNSEGETERGEENSCQNDCLYLTHLFAEHFGPDLNLIQRTKLANGPGDVEIGQGALAPQKRWLHFISPVFVQAFTLTFLAEWGDRSQLTTIVLAAREDPFGVAVGGTIGHCLCTGLAVIGGRMIAQKISVRTVTIIGGIVFLAFAFSALFISPEAG
uniref:Transmembrane protein 165 n=1 Tax=Latimeria chalumnae TaxID=7897 RepID=H3AZ19_LATCH